MYRVCIKCGGIWALIGPSFNDMHSAVAYATVNAITGSGKAAPYRIMRDGVVATMWMSAN